MRFCPNCGNPLGGSPRYCAGCATHVGAENGPASTPPWQASPPPPTASSPPWAVSAQPPAGDPAPLGDRGAAADQAVTGDQVAAAITGNPGASPPGWGAARPGRWSRLSAGHGMTITAMVTTVALLVTGGIATWQAGQMGSHMRAANVSLARHTAGRARGHARSRAASPSADSPATGSPTTGSPTTGSPTTGSPTTGAPTTGAAVIVAGVEVAKRRSRKWREGFIPHPATWLRADGWLDDHGSPDLTVVASAAGPPPTPEMLSRRAEHYADTGEWKDHWGPFPQTAGAR